MIVVRPHERDELRVQLIADGARDKCWRCLLASRVPDAVIDCVLIHIRESPGITCDEILQLAGEMAREEPATRGKGRKTVALERAILDVLERFDGSMTSRQIFYQAVSAGDVANNARENARVQRAVLAMRRDKRIAYDRIVDRTRRKHHREGWANVRALMQSAATAYHRDSWVDADVVPMIACEKQALEGIFSEAVDAWGVSLWTLRGFASESFAWEWSEEIRELSNAGKRVSIFYFGDFDPSGLAIEIDAKEKLAGFGATFEWARTGLLNDDFDDFDLVNVPVKKTDTRAKAFLSKFGDLAAELDALPPDELRRRIDDAIAQYADRGQWAQIRAVEKAERESLEIVTRHFDVALAAARAA